MRSKLFVILIVFILLLVGFFLLRTNKLSQTKTAVSQTISPTPTLVQSTQEIINNSKIIGGMRQYISDKYKFSVLYPADWQLLDEPNLSGIEIQKINTQGMGFSISIRINDNSGKLTLYDYAKSQALSPQDIPQKVTVGNVEGYKLQYLPEGLLTTVYLPYTTSDKVLYFFAGGEFDKSSQGISYYKNIVNTVLNSLKLN